MDIRQLSQHGLREVLGLVPQKGILFSGTIASNIKLAGEEQISDGQMREAADTAQAREFIDGKPEGYDSPVAQGGSNVSGGQKQRLAIARAIAKDPKIYLFDDSFSALDYKTDAALRQALGKRRPMRRSSSWRSGSARSCMRIRSSCWTTAGSPERALMRSC